MSSSVHFRTALILTILLLATVLCRVVAPWSYVFRSGADTPVLLEADPWYHARHAAMVAQHFPHLQRWDIAVRFPSGERGLNQGLFDLSMGTAAFILGAGHPSDQLVLMVAAWTPIVLSIAIMFALFRLGAILSDDTAGLVASALLVLAPGPLLAYSLLGFSDHHAAEVLLALLTAIGLIRCTRGQSIVPDLIAPLPLVAFLFTWTGAPVFEALANLALLFAGLLGVLRNRRHAEEARAACLASERASIRYGLGLLVWYVPLSMLLPDLVMFIPANKLIIFGALTMTVGVPLVLRTLTAAILPGPRRMWGVAGLAGCAAVLLCAALSKSGTWAIGMLFDTRTSLIAEQQPFSWRSYFFWYGLLGVLGPLGMLTVARDLLRGKVAPAPWTVAWIMGAGQLALWIATADFLYAPPVWLALFGTVPLLRLPARARPLTAVVAIAAMLASAAFRITSPPWPTAAMLASMTPIPSDWLAALHWMRSATPAEPVPIDAPTAPWDEDKGHLLPDGTYGVLSAWDYGHWIAFLAQRPVNASESLSVDECAWFASEDSTSAAKALDRMHTRYVVVDARMAADLFPAEVMGSGGSVDPYFERTSSGVPMLSKAYHRTVLASLYEADGNGSGAFRLVYESPGKSALAMAARHGRVGRMDALRVSIPMERDASGLLKTLADTHRKARTPDGTVLYDVEIASTVKIFERVAGAILVGTGPVGATVDARVLLRSGASKRIFTWIGAAQIDPSGHYALTVPYATTPMPHSDVQALGPYAVTVERHEHSVTVQEQAVLQHSIVNVRN